MKNARLRDLRVIDMTIIKVQDKKYGNYALYWWVRGQNAMFPGVFLCFRALNILIYRGLHYIEVSSLTLIPTCSGPARLAGGCQPLEAGHPHHGQVVPRGQC